MRNISRKQLGQQTALVYKYVVKLTTALGSLATNAAGQLNIFGHNGNSLGMDSAQVGVFEQPDEVGLRCFLQRHHCGTLEAKVALEVLSNFADQPLEGKFANEKFCGLLEFSNFTKSDSSGTISMGLLYTTGGGGRLTGGLGRELLAGSFASSRFASGLLGSGHCELEVIIVRVERKAKNFW